MAGGCASGHVRIPRTPRSRSFTMASRKLYRTRFSSGRRPIDNKRRSSTARAKARLILEYLEDRLAPAGILDHGAGGTLSFVLSPNETVAIVANANTYEFTTSGTNTFTNNGVTTPGDFHGF